MLKWDPDRGSHIGLSSTTWQGLIWGLFWPLATLLLVSLLVTLSYLAMTISMGCLGLRKGLLNLLLELSPAPQQEIAQGSRRVGVVVTK